ncbi:MAG: NADPH-dependent FMN reductase [Rhodomicrobiaceae bacterium]
MAQRYDVVAICGSLRKGSFNRMILNTLPELAPDGMIIGESPPIDAFPLYNADLQQASGFPDAVMVLASAIRAADGVIIVSPEYNYSVPGLLKNAIDWVSRLPNQPFAGKPIALQSAAGGVLGGARAQYHMRQIMVFLDALVFNKPEVFVTFAPTKVDAERGVVSDEPTRDTIKAQLAAFAQFIDRVGKVPSAT